MKKGYTLLTNESSPLNHSSSIPEHIKKVFMLLVRLVVILLGLITLFFCAHKYAETEQLDSLILAPSCIVLLGLGIWKLKGNTTFSFSGRIIHFLSGAFGLLSITTFMNTVSTNATPKTFVLMPIGCALFIIFYLTRKHTYDTLQKPENNTMPANNKIIFDSYILTKTLPDIITEMLGYTNSTAICTSVHSITYNELNPSGAVATLNTGQEIQIEMNISEEGGLEVNLPPDIVSRSKSAQFSNVL